MDVSCVLNTFRLLTLFISFEDPPCALDSERAIVRSADVNGGLDSPRILGHKLLYSHRWTLNHRLWHRVTSCFLYDKPKNKSYETIQVFCFRDG